MGIVYLAEHPTFGQVCLKVIKPDFQPNNTMLRRFQREAEAARRIQHPNVVRCYGLKKEGEFLYLIQEFVAGGDLDAYMRKQGGRLPLAEAMRLGREIALGLSAAHEIGMVHRDLKPPNVLLSAERVAKVGDLGLVLQVDGEPLDGKTILTQKGQVLGTPHYMAPEQWQESHDVDARADLYALGIMLHHMLSGEYPLAGKSLSKLMFAHCGKSPKPLREHLPGAPPMIEKIILRLLEKEREDRPSSAMQVAEALEKVADSLGCGDIVRGLGMNTETLVSAVPVDSHLGSSIQSMPPIPMTQIVTPHDKPPQSTAPGTADPLIGKIIGGKFKIQSLRGKGGMGVVYKAHHNLLSTDYAIKLLLPRFATDKEFRSRFLREAKILQTFTHEGAVTLRDFGEYEGSLYMALDFAPGSTLSEVFKKDGPFTQDRALTLAQQILPCLEKAHQAGLVHRDLKPQNLLVETLPNGGDRTRVLDFGIAKVVDEASAQGDAALTGTGITLGTPHYMSPEQDAGDPVDGRSDLYAFACVLYELTAGRRPLEAKTIRKLRYMIQFEKPEPLSQVAQKPMSAGFAQAIMMGLQKTVEDRPTDANHFLTLLEAGAAGSSPVAPQSPPAVDVHAMTERLPTRQDTLQIGLQSYGAMTQLAPPPPPSSGILTKVLGLVLILSIAGVGGLFLLKENPARIDSFDKTYKTNKASVNLRGQASRSDFEIMIDGKPYKHKAGADGEFEIKFPVEQGRFTKTLKIVASDGTYDTTTFNVSRDSIAPQLIIPGLNKGRAPLGSDGWIKGTAKDSGKVTLRYSFQGGLLKDVDPSSDGSFAIRIPKNNGALKVTFQLKDDSENIRNETITFFPKLSLTLAEQDRWTIKKSLTIAGKTSYGGVQVFLDKKSTPTDENGAFQFTVELAEGQKTFTVEAADGTMRTKETFTIDYDPTAPQIRIEGQPDKAQVLIDLARSLKGTVDEANLSTFTVNGKEVEVNQGSFETTIKGEPGDSVKIIATDFAGNETTVTGVFSKLARFLSRPSLPSLTNKKEMILEGQVAPKNARVVASILDKNFEAIPDNNGHFSLTVPIIDGINNICLQVTLGKAGSGSEHNYPINCDSIPPEIHITGLDKKLLYLQKDQQINGSIKNETLKSFGTLSLNGKAVELDKNFEFAIPMTETKIVDMELTAIDKAQNKTTVKFRLFPLMKITELKGAKKFKHSKAVTLDVQLNYSGATVRIMKAGEELLTRFADTAKVRLELVLPEGANKLTLEVKSTKSPPISRDLEIVIDTTKPEILVKPESREGVITVSEDRLVTGQVKEANLKTFQFNGEPIKINSDGKFQLVIPDWNIPKKGIFKALDLAGNESSIEFTFQSPKSKQSITLVRDILFDHEQWQKADPAIQDLAIQKVVKTLAPRFVFLSTKKYSCNNQTNRIATFKHATTGIEMNLIPGGQYTMGTSKGASDEAPAHPVKISRPFLIGRYEVRQKEWDSIGGPEKRKFSGSDLPMEGVSWEGIKEWLRKIGEGLRLPSETEWEYACRAGTKSRYYWGPAFNPAYAWFSGNSKNKTHIGSDHDTKANAFGLVDMCGNVWEWVEDDYANRYSGQKTEKPFESSRSERLKVIRGGGWYDKDRSYMTSTTREEFHPKTKSGSTGFRVVVTVKVK
jgi:serine/threonine protein kinase/formylglycine-generating enzyme required for sulfatase activity